MKLACVMVAAAATVYAQPAFEVASLKLDTGVHMGWSMSQSKGQTILTHMPLRDCIQMAFDVKDYSLEGPSWMDSVRLDIVAKPPVGAPQSQFNQMLQGLLVERFKMVFHRESKLINGYALVEAKGGLKIHKVDNPNGGRFGASDGEIWGNNQPIGQMASMLAKQVNRPVQDLTGIEKVISFKIRWVPDTAIGADPGPTLAMALQEELGLKLEARKLPVDVLVIDRIERVPIEN